LTQVQPEPSNPRSEHARTVRDNLISIGSVLGKVNQRAIATTEPGAATAEAGFAPGTEIDVTVRAFSAEFGDLPHLRANRGQALRLWRESGRSERQFVGLLHEARSLTRDVIAASRHGTAEPVRNGMAYFFACVRDLLVYRPLPAESGERDALAEGESSAVITAIDQWTRE
jgi:hypothetical protein